MNLIQDILLINKVSVKKSIKLLIKNWPVMFTGFVYSILNVALFLVLGILFRGILGIFAGIVTFIAMSAMISNYLYLLYNIIKHEKITIQDFKDGFKVYLRKIYSILIIGWLASLLSNMVLGPIISFNNIVSPAAFSFITSFLVLVLLNALPETIYQKHYSAWESIVYAFNFIRENWIEWGIPNIILMGILYFTTGRLISDIFAIQVGLRFSLSANGIVLYLVGQLLFSYIMIYRGVLYEILSTSTRRKRMFMRNLYK